MLRHWASPQRATQLTLPHSPIASPACRLTALGTSRTVPGCPRLPRRLGQSEVSSPAASPFPKSANKPFLANLRYGKFNLGSFRGRNQLSRDFPGDVPCPGESIRGHIHWECPNRRRLFGPAQCPRSLRHSQYIDTESSQALSPDIVPVGLDGERNAFL